jgi:hypothetical protein
MRGRGASEAAGRFFSRSRCACSAETTTTLECTGPASAIAGFTSFRLGRSAGLCSLRRAGFNTVLGFSTETVAGAAGCGRASGDAVAGGGALAAPLATTAGTGGAGSRRWAVDLGCAAARCPRSTPACWCWAARSTTRSTTRLERDFFFCSRGLLAAGGAAFAKTGLLLRGGNDFSSGAARESNCRACCRRATYVSISLIMSAMCIRAHFIFCGLLVFRHTGSGNRKARVPVLNLEEIAA